jgi:hypothetical protein
MLTSDPGREWTNARSVPGGAVPERKELELTLGSLLGDGRVPCRSPSDVAPDPRRS